MKAKDSKLFDLRRLTNEFGQDKSNTDNPIAEAWYSQ